MKQKRRSNKQRNHILTKYGLSIQDQLSNNIPDAFSVRLTTNADIAGKRLFNDKTRGKEDSQYSSIKEATAEREERRIGERNRYLNRYGVDLKEKIIMI